MENEEKNTQQPSEETLKTKRQQWEKNMRKKYPDIQDEDELYGASMDGYDSEHEMVKGFRADNETAKQHLTNNPDVANFIGSVMRGDNLSLSMSYLADLIHLEEGTPEYEAYLASVEDRKAAAIENEQNFVNFEENMARTTESLQAFAASKQMSDEDAAEFVSFLISLEDKLINGTLTEDDFEIYYKAFTYDSDIETAHEEGIVDGKNQAIKEKRKKPRKGDGLPATGSSASTPPATAQTQKSIQDETLDALADRGERNRELYN